MSRLSTTRWLVFLAVAAALMLALAAAPASAAPASQSTVSVVVFAYVDVASPGDVNAPCNLQFDDEDEQYALSNPLPSMWFNLQDGGGTELARQESSALATLQRVRFEQIEEQQSYRLVLEAPPSGWALCPQESATRDLVDTDFVLGSARETYHFYRPDQATPEPTQTGTVPTATHTPTATVTPGPSPTGPTPTPTKTATLAPPPDGGDGEDGEDGGGTGGSGGGTSGSGVAVSGVGVSRGEYGRIEGIAFIDTNANGAFDPGEPGLNDVQVNLHGGGLELKHITDYTGTYNFDILGDGQYDVFVNPGDEWYITTPDKYTVSVAGLLVSGVNFGLIRHTDLPADYDKTATTTTVTVQTGIRLPSTGVADLPAAGALAGLALLLGVVGLVGLSTERWWKGRQ
ncbi:MAG: SdrD B-like domain-containing protein [Anaerolineae bacterium]